MGRQLSQIYNTYYIYAYTNKHKQNKYIYIYTSRINGTICHTFYYGEVQSSRPLFNNPKRCEIRRSNCLGSKISIEWLLIIRVQAIKLWEERFALKIISNKISKPYVLRIKAIRSNTKESKYFPELWNFWQRNHRNSY